MIISKVRDNRGSTMVEVLIAITLLLIVLSSLTHLIKFSSTMLMEAKDMTEDNQTLSSNMYKKDVGFTDLPDKIYVEISDYTRAENGAKKTSFDMEEVKVQVYREDYMSIWRFEKNR